ncbi:immunoglobulin superfamily member 6 isoform X2 [Carassius gibelio]|uniref:immunoglobulin superfamily member 6 isoform X2 n=1 Tax=Carassius gibelio TaxID=101364 RepID=UPI002277A56E|nr:immunoglobulin superfamily member 6 isoform X2 [Carassius gibelio]
MNLGFFFTIAFLMFSTVSGCKVDVQQSPELIREKRDQSVSIPCSVSVSSCPNSQPHISWYVFRNDSHYQLDLKANSLKYTQEQHGLKISSLSEPDSGVYLCAAALLDVAHYGAQAIGQGTTLKVSETGLNVSQALLLTLLVLLIVYSLLVLVIIICIKENPAKQVLFSGVMQELAKRNLVGGRKVQSHYKVSQDKSTALQNQHHSEDLYQNLDE